MSSSSLGGSGRSSAEIDTILKAAKLDKRDLLPVAQEICFAANFSGHEYRLVELPPELANSIKAGSRLVFRGDGNEAAVLCSEQSTFEIKEAETSNSLLIFSQLSFPEEKAKSKNGSDSSSGSKSPDSVSNLPVISFGNDEVMEPQSTIVRAIQDVAHSYFELKKINPNLSRIRNLLASNPYKGSKEDEGSGELFNLEKLLSVIPASAGEIKGYLDSIRVIEIDGSLQLIDDTYCFRVLSLVTGLVDENSWRNDRIPKSVVVTTLLSLEPPLVIDKIFDWFFIPSVEDNEDMYAMKEYEICRFLGEILLQQAGRFNLSEFLAVWKQSVPEGLVIDLQQLEGLAVTNTSASPPVIWHFPQYNLPDSPLDRFAVLFEAKPKWKLEEIVPYLKSMPSSQSVGILLTKYTRVSSLNGVKYYTSKHSK